MAEPELDMGEAFREYAHDRQEKRRENTKRSTELLKHEGVPFDSRNGGAHLIVAGIVDFYPGTGLFIPRDRQYGKDRGVFRLLKFIRARRLDHARAQSRDALGRATADSDGSVVGGVAGPDR